MAYSLSTLPHRFGHSCIQKESKLYLFGGNTNNKDENAKYSNDLIEINLETKSWRKLTREQLSTIPCARNCHSACLKSDNEMIVIGGKPNTSHNDIWLYEFKENLWTKLKTIGSEIISSRFGHAATIYKDQLFVFGGFDFISNGVLKILNLQTLEWKRVEIESSSEILPRYYHASVLDYETGEWYFHGGKAYDSSIVLSETIKISLNSLVVDENETVKCKVEILVSNMDVDGQFARYGHSMILEGRKLFIVGGCNSSQDFTNCASLDLENISSGWEINNSHVLSSILNETNQKDSRPFLHSLVKFENDYFIFGGCFQYPKPLQFDIKQFNDSVYDDIFRNLLAFLNTNELLNLQMVSKNLRICQLATEDQFWKDFYFKKIKELRMCSRNKFMGLLDRHSYKNSDYRAKIIQCTREIISKTFENQRQRMEKIEKLEARQDGKYYFSKDEILQYSKTREILENEGKYTVVHVGDIGSGKTSVHIRNDSGEFKEQYLPYHFTMDVIIDYMSYQISLNEAEEAFMPVYRNLDIDAILLSFSCGLENSLFNIPKLVNEIRNLWKSKHVPLILLNNKIDHRTDPILILSKTDEPITFEQGELMAKKMGCSTYLETCSKTGYGICDLGEIIIKTMAISRDDEHVKHVMHVKRGKKCLLQ